MRSATLLILPALLSLVFAVACGKKGDDEKSPGSSAQKQDTAQEGVQATASRKPQVRSPYAKAPGTVTHKPALSKEEAAVAEQALAYSEALAAAVDANAADCDKMAGAVKKVVDANLALFPKMRALKDSNARKIIEEKHSVRLAELRKKIEPLQVCLRKSKKLAKAYAPAMMK